MEKNYMEKNTWHNLIHLELVNLRKAPNSQTDYNGKLTGLCWGFCLFLYPLWGKENQILHANLIHVSSEKM